MPKKPLILDPSEYDLNNVVADIEEIRSYNPQRYEMEHLTAVCFEDDERKIIVGYKDLTEEEFWVRGHMPGVPLMPGVIMCEASAQLGSFFAAKRKFCDCQMFAFAGIKEVAFRGVVRPGDRFVIVAQMVRARRRMFVCEFQCFVGEDRVCEGVLKGSP